jgi:aryl-alcohol dehydrogenase-like predicted oxidoreductase
MLRPLGATSIRVSPIALGCWPISGMTSLDVTAEAARATLDACLDSGVNFLDTAYCYGAHGESERLVAEILRGRRDAFVVATKGGLAWDSAGKQVRDARPATLVAHCEESLRRLETDFVDLLYLHAPDRTLPIEDSATALASLLAAGKTRAVGVSNVTLDELARFHAVCPVAVVQPPYNLLQREIEVDLVPWCLERSISICPYWPLLKGLLAGRLARDHHFDPRDGRAKYPMFQGPEYQRNQDLVDDLRRLADRLGRTVSQVVLNWTIHRPGITAALVGAKRPDQLRENAAAAGWSLAPDDLAEIDRALAARGSPQSRPAVG